jgi:Na+-driven multidrug efflux pump
MLQYLVGTASWMAIMRLMSAFGSEALAGYTIAIRVIIFALLPSWGISNAAATMVGQNLGAGKPDRGEKAVWLCMAIDAAFLAVLGTLFWLGARGIIGVFTSDPGVVQVGVRCLRVLTLFFPIWAVGMVSVQSFNGAGDTRTPTVVNLLAYWFIQLPLAAFMAWPLEMASDGIFWAVAAAQFALAAIAVSLFRRGRWKNVHV